MAMNEDELAGAFAIYASWGGGGIPARAQRWIERLRKNEEELRRFCAAPDPHVDPHVPQRTAPLAPSWTGAAPAARALPADAAASWQRAREQASLNAFTYLPPALEAAAPGFLGGLPIAVKDLIAVAGMPRTGGSASETPTVMTQDAAAVASMKQRGAVVIGLANLHELAFGATSANPVFGAVVNPAAPDRIPGGSSGGSAAAVAAGIVDLALGSDTGGSVRVPAACCGVVGFKPGYDVISREGAMDAAPSLDHLGPLGASVADCARAFAALTGMDRDPGLPDLRFGRVRVARLTGFFEAPLHPDVRRALDNAQEAMAADGAAMSPLDIEGMDLAAAIYFITVSTEAAATHAGRLREHADLLGEDVRVRLEMASLLPGHWYIKAQRLRRLLSERLHAAFAHADVLFCATMRAPAARIGEEVMEIDGRSFPLLTAINNLTLPFNLSGLPAITIPWCESAEGAPIGLQLIAAPGQEWKLLQIAQRLEALARRRNLHPSP